MTRINVRMPLGKEEKIAVHVPALEEPREDDNYDEFDYPPKDEDDE